MLNLRANALTPNSREPLIKSRRISFRISSGTRLFPDDAKTPAQCAEQNLAGLLLAVKKVLPQVSQIFSTLTFARNQTVAQLGEQNLLFLARLFDLKIFPQFEQTYSREGAVEACNAVCSAFDKH